MQRYLFFLISFLFLSSCNPHFHVTEIAQKGYSVAGASAGFDSAYTLMLRPYADSVNKTMNEVLVASELDMKKDIPNSVLGNFLADAYLWGAKEKINPRAEIAFMNHGGVRINRMGKGQITRGNIYEVMPFDNALVVLEVQGVLLQSYLDRIAAEGGGGGVSGLVFTIKDKKAVNVMIGGKPLDPAQTYVMVNSDYLVDGGGGFTAFKKLPQQRSSYLQRDAIIDYCKSVRAAGKKLTTEPLQRIVQ